MATTITERPSLAYTVIKDLEQYNRYCKRLFELIEKEDVADSDEIELLELLVDNYDDVQYPLEPGEPVEVLKFLMEQHDMRAKDLVNILNIGKETVSKMLNKKVGISKESITLLSEYFKVDASLFIESSSGAFSAG
jgi:HTH-type transcriptional regulator/antitoxin HigA